MGKRNLKLQAREKPDIASDLLVEKRKPSKVKSAGNLVVLEENATQFVLKKHVGLIHCENKLSLMQRKICNIFLFNALDKIHDQEIHEISLKQLCSLIGYNSNDSQLIKKAIKHLISIVMEWNLLDDVKFIDAEVVPEEAISWNASSLLAGASIKKGMVYYSYSPQIKTVLSSLDIYGRINLFIQAKFNSTYSLVLYENCVRFKNIEQTSWFTIPLFRSLMGVSEGKYSTFKEFKRNVITVAVKEINQKSDIFIEPVFRKSGRNISAIQFLLRENPSYQPSFKKISPAKNNPKSSMQACLPLENSLLHLLMEEFQLKKKQAMEVMTAYPNAYLMEKMQWIKKRKSKSIDHLGAYLLAALKFDYVDAEAKSKNIAQNLEQENRYLREAKAASEIASLKNKYMAYKLNNYQRFVAKQKKSIQEKILAQFEQSLQEKRETLRVYKKNGLASPFAMSEYIRFIEKEYPHIIRELLSFDDFLTSEEI